MRPFFQASDTLCPWGHKKLPYPEPVQWFTNTECQGLSRVSKSFLPWPYLEMQGVGVELSLGPSVPKVDGLPRRFPCNRLDAAGNKTFSKRTVA